MKTFYLIGNSCNFQLVVHLVLISICYSCASYKTQYSSNEENWESERPDSSLVLTHQMYLVGDAGNALSPETTPTLAYLHGKLASESKNSSILFLGDNIYPSGIPPKPDLNPRSSRKFRKASDKRRNAEYSLNTQLEVLRQFDGTPIFIPGNHDWKSDPNVSGQQELVQRYMQSVKPANEYKDTFLPKNGEFGPILVDFNDNIAAIIFDSHHLLTHWKEKSATKKEMNNGEYFKFQLDSLINSNRLKNVVIAMHHPPYTYGPHGSRFHLKQYLFPLTEAVPWLYIPTPALGTLYAIFRGFFTKADVRNCKNKKLIKTLLAATENKGNFIFASGHEHTLQYIERKNHKFIVSGSGSKTSPVGLGTGSLFASASTGFSTLSFFKGGETWVTYYHVSNDGERAVVVFQRKIKDSI